MRNLQKKYVDLKNIFWFVIFSLLFIPIVNSFIVNLNKLVKSVLANNYYKTNLYKLYNDNELLRKKVKFYKSPQGIRTLVKERLNKVEEGEIVIKFDDNN